MDWKLIGFLFVLFLLTRSGFVDSVGDRDYPDADIPGPCQGTPCTCIFTKEQWTIDCSWRELDAIPKFNINSSFNIVEINLSGGFLTKVDDYAFKGITTLKGLNFNHNNINDLQPYAFSGVEETLQDLDLSHNLLSNVSALQGLRNIKWLSLRTNRLTTKGADVFHLLGQRLAVLDLSQNKLERFPQSLKYLDQLQTLLLNWNKLEDIDKEVLNGMKNLENLEIAENKLKTLPAQTFKTLDLLFRLSVSGNEIEEISPQAFYGLDYNLRQIDLSFNHLKRLQFCAFRGLQLLEVLALNGNPFKCDCQLIWYRNARLPHAPFPAATCAEPNEYSGLLINSFPHDDCSIQDMYLWGMPCTEKGSLPIGSTSQVTSRPTGSLGGPTGDTKVTISPLMSSSGSFSLLSLVYIALAIAVLSVFFTIVFAVVVCRHLKKCSATLKAHAKRLEMPSNKGAHVHFNAAACESTIEINALEGYEQVRDEGYNYINPYGPTYETIPIANTFTNRMNSFTNHNHAT
ncbi:slit homolog 1 protein [Lingula anatina]|uniref:Slit homolog 1 protein n=1 Tax=Lingula anatina TaxID=7574 RepID=A0A1S3IPJ0_LINAN|nr:slit homolog 1 protein [Lingula anatina]|eukprot:XP_013399988.1 slit homolog 1 protein [Lingula anatina]